ATFARAPGIDPSAQPGRARACPRPSLAAACPKRPRACIGKPLLRPSPLNPPPRRNPMARSAREAVIVSTARTGLAKSFRGSLNHTRPDDMVAHCIKSALAKVPQLDVAEIDDVVVGCGFPEGPQGFNIGRNVAILAGLPHSVPGSTVSRFCSS